MAMRAIEEAATAELRSRRRQALPAAVTQPAAAARRRCGLRLSSDRVAHDAKLKSLHHQAFASSELQIFSPFRRDRPTPDRCGAVRPPSHLTLARAAAMPLTCFPLANRNPKPSVPAGQRAARASPPSLACRQSCRIIPPVHRHPRFPRITLPSCSSPSFQSRQRPPTTPA